MTLSRATVNRLVEAERKRTPSGNLEMWLQAANDRWEHDNRWQASKFEKSVVNLEPGGIRKRWLIAKKISRGVETFNAKMGEE